MFIEFVIGVLLLGSLFHLSFGVWSIKVLSPFGSSKRSNVSYGTFVLGISLGLYLFERGLTVLVDDYLYLGGLFAIAYTVVLGLWVTRGTTTSTSK